MDKKKKEMPFGAKILSAEDRFVKLQVCLKRIKEDFYSR
jgi:hypothetical protein